MRQYFRLAASGIASLVVLLSTVFVNAANVSAAGVGGIPTPQPTSSSSLSIIPRENAIIVPGQSTKGTLVIGNQDPAAPLYLTLRVIDFTYSGTNGTAKYFISPKAPQTTWSLKPYLKLPGSVTIGPGQSKTINYTISIPRGLGAGSYYSAILYESGLGDTGNIGLSASGVTMLFVNVPGTVHEQLMLQKFGPYYSTTNGNTGNFMSYINTTEPNMMAFSVKNSGNAVEAPVGSIVIKKWGHKYTTISNVNPNSDLTLLGQTRLYASCLQYLPAGENNINAGRCANPHLGPGHYSATLEVYYGQNGNITKSIIKTVSFWYIPEWLLIIILIIILLLILAGWRLYRKIRRLLDKSNVSRGAAGSRYRLRVNR